VNVRTGLGEGAERAAGIRPETITDTDNRKNQENRIPVPTRNEVPPLLLTITVLGESFRLVKRR
jgi:hypothetical protein